MQTQKKNPSADKRAKFGERKCDLIKFENGDGNWKIAHMHTCKREWEKEKDSLTAAAAMVLVHWTKRLIMKFIRVISIVESSCAHAMFDHCICIMSSFVWDESGGDGQERTREKCHFIVNDTNTHRHTKHRTMARKRLVRDRIRANEQILDKS